LVDLEWPCFSRSIISLNLTAIAYVLVICEADKFFLAYNAIRLAALFFDSGGG
jgi:hypothetical protein